MKKLLYLSLAVMLFFQCDQGQEVSEIVPESELTLIKQSPASFSSLLNYRDFSSAYEEASNQLKSKRKELTSGIDLSRVRSSNGMLAFSSEKSFRAIYDQIGTTDSIWMENYDQQIESLLRTAMANREIVNQFKDEETIENEIEEILEASDINDFDIQKDIAAKMPVRTLWDKVKKLDDEWLNNSGEDLDLSKDPANFYVDDEQIQLLLNEKSEINLLDTVRVFEEDATLNKATAGRLQSVGGGGCRTWRKSFNDFNNGSRKLKVIVKVRSYVVVKKLKARIIGWKRKNGKWKRRRFSKTLYMFGRAIAHRANLQTNCDPVFGFNVSLNKTKKRRSFNLSRHWWGPDWYLGACRNNFSASGNVGSLWVTTTIN